MSRKSTTTSRRSTERDYEYTAPVTGFWSGIVRGRDATSARSNAERDMRSEGLAPNGKITVKRR